LGNEIPAIDFDNYQSPFSWRYGSPEMRAIWSESAKRLQMRQVWLALARAQSHFGLVSTDEIKVLAAAADKIDIRRSSEIEAEVRHDVMAELRTFAEQCGPAGGKLHLGATSADITDNVDVLRTRQALKVIAGRMTELLWLLASRIEETADLTVMAYTHIQPAEPTTFGYRLAGYAQDLLIDYRVLSGLATELKGKGFKGAVGSQASFADLLEDSGESAVEMEMRAAAELDLPLFEIATQTYSRHQDLVVMQLLARIAAVLHKFALDFRLLQSPLGHELSEPFGDRQVGSSAMPFKRNPINSENICSLARYVASLPGVAWDNASQAVLERSLDDSANRRIFLAEGCLAVDEILQRAAVILEGMQIDRTAVEGQVERYGPFAATERLLAALVKRGVSRQDAHEWLREDSMAAWEQLRRQPGINPLQDIVSCDKRVGQHLSAAEIGQLMDVSTHVGTAPQRARTLAAAIQAELSS